MSELGEFHHIYIHTAIYLYVLTMVALSEEKPLELWAFCSDTFCEEDSSAIPTSDLFQFTADIKGSCAAITIDDGSFINLVSIEVVEKLQLFTHPHFRPYLLAT